MKYSLRFLPAAEKNYAALKDAKLLKGINRVLDEIKQDPFKFKKLSGPLAHLRSAKTFSFRILYQIENKQLIVWVVSIDNRKDVYR